MQRGWTFPSNWATPGSFLTRKPRMRRNVSKSSFVTTLIAGLALTLSACSTMHGEPITDCPPPPADLLLPPKQLQKIETPELSQPEAVELWLEDTRAFHHNALSMIALQQWGAAQCGWPSPSNNSSR